MIKTPENIGQQITCQLCETENDDQSHIIQCIVIKLKCPEVLNINKTISDIIFRGSMQELETFAKVYEKAYRIRNELIKLKILELSNIFG